ncbi:MAG: oxygen-independent coproporphyrinogen III oxidase [Deltaproteobacteria bacterium]|nr:oxygen-independent coproporphyrinogen III oxidase [Deltaproteobacteria bacterium]
MDVTSEMLNKYNVSAPRYTSYPAIPFWKPADGTQAAAWIAAMEPARQTSLSLYTHIPFCKTRCYYCGCFVVISPHEEIAQPYADALEKEMELAAGQMKHRWPVAQYHLGGGTPNYLNIARMERLVAKARALFPFQDDAEMSIEVDPRTLNKNYLERVRALGFNRLSLGVQDFDPEVMETVNRVQPYDMVAGVVEQARKLGFLSVNFDLIYGLPKQTTATFQKTMAQVKTLGPDRVALYHYAHLPDSHPYHRRFDPADLPGSQEKMDIFLQARERFLSWGYQPIGLDHFAKPDDDLSVSFRNRSMRRNFMGYTTKAGTDMLAFGISAISDFNHAFWQNEKKLPHYYKALEKGELPVIRGLELSGDDRLRRQVIQNLFCQGGVNFGQMEQAYQIPFQSHFAGELEALAPLQDDGLVTLSPEGITVTDQGQLFLRNIAMTFDAYLRKGSKPPVQFSRTA